VNKAIEILKIVILVMFFELKTSYAINKVNKCYELRGCLDIGESD